MDPKILKEAFDRLGQIEKSAISESDETEDAIEELQAIQEELFEVIERLRDCISAYMPDELRYWEAYGLAHLKVIAGSDQYASGDASINDLIEKLQNSEDEMEEDAGADLDAMQKRSAEQGDEIGALKSKLDAIKARVNSNEPGYDDRSIDRVRRVPRWKK